MSVKCAYCGRFISHDDMATGEALFHFEPLSDFGPEVSEWTCRQCVLPPASAAGARSAETGTGSGPKDRQSGDGEASATPKGGQ